MYLVLRILLPGNPFILYTNTSKMGLGAILTQSTSPRGTAHFFLSPKLSLTEHKYPTIEKKVLAMLWAIEGFKQYLWGHSHTVITSHVPLQWLHRMKNTNPVNEVVPGVTAVPLHSLKLPGARAY